MKRDEMRGGGMTRDDMLRAIGLARRLVYDGERIAFSGRSLFLILISLQTSLASVPEGTESLLLDVWEQELPFFRQRLLEAAGQVHRGDDGAVMPLVTENAASRALGMCPPGPKLP